MSVYQRAPPSDIDDNTIAWNPKFSKPHGLEKGVYVTTGPCRQCKYCNWTFSLEEKLCPECGCPNFRQLKENQRIDAIPRKYVAQSKRKLFYCWNEIEDGMTGERRRHEYSEAKIPVIYVITIGKGASGSETPEVYYEHCLEIRCKVCNGAYQRVSGRNATPQEVQDWKAGKIETATKMLLPVAPGESQ